MELTKKQKNLEKLGQLLKMMDEQLTKEDFVKAFENVINLVLRIEKRNSEAVDLIEKTYANLLGKTKDAHNSDFSDFKNKAQEFVDARLAKIARDYKTEIMDLVDRRVATIKDGKDGKDGEKGKDGSPDTPTQVRDKLKGLSGDERLDISAIKGLEKGANIMDKSIQLIGGGRGIQLKVNGVKKGLVKTINLIAGTNITITHTIANGRNDLLFDAVGGAGFTTLPATGTVNGINIDFIFTEKPTYIISDGAWYKENKGWSWNGGTLTATLTIPPNNDIYGFK